MYIYRCWPRTLVTRDVPAAVAYADAYASLRELTRVHVFDHEGDGSLTHTLRAAYADPTRNVFLRNYF